MNWINFKNRQPIDGQKVLVFTISHEMYMGQYNQNRKVFIIHTPYLNNVDEYYESVCDEFVLYWASPEKPEFE